MATPRPYWKGFLKLSLVSCPIALYPAVSAAERVSFWQVNKRTGYRLRHQLVDFVTGEAVESSDKGRGYEVGENQYLLVDDREIEQARQVRPEPDSSLFIELHREDPKLPLSRGERPNSGHRATCTQRRTNWPSRPQKYRCGSAVIPSVNVLHDGEDVRFFAGDRD